MCDSYFMHWNTTLCNFVNYTAPSDRCLQCYDYVIQHCTYHSSFVSSVAVVCFGRRAQVRRLLRDFGTPAYFAANCPAPGPFFTAPIVLRIHHRLTIFSVHSLVSPPGFCNGSTLAASTH